MTFTQIRLGTYKLPLEVTYIKKVQKNEDVLAGVNETPLAYAHGVSIVRNLCTVGLNYGRWCIRDRSQVIARAANYTRD